MALGACGWARWFRVYVLGLLWLAGYANVSVAQSAVDGAIAGRVVDQRGDSVAGARVTVKSTATGAAQSTVSALDGTFLVARVAPGAYEVVIAAQGFGAVAVPVIVELGAIANADARLGLEQVITLLSVDAAPVTLSGEAPVPEPAMPLAAEFDTQGSVTTAEQVDLLPVDGRRWQSFALLLPGANSGSGTESEAISFRGPAVTQNASMIDRASNDRSFGAALPPLASAGKNQDRSRARSPINRDGQATSARFPHSGICKGMLLLCVDIVTFYQFQVDSFVNVFFALRSHRFMELNEEI